MKPLLIVILFLSSCAMTFDPYKPQPQQDPKIVAAINGLNTVVMKLDERMKALEAKKK